MSQETAQPYSPLGQWLRGHRIAHGLTQQEVAIRSGLGQPHVSELENGIGDSQPSTLQRYGAALGATLLVELVEGSPETAGTLECTSPTKRVAAYANRTLEYRAGAINIVRRIN